MNDNHDERRRVPDQPLPDLRVLTLLLLASVSGIAGALFLLFA